MLVAAAQLVAPYCDAVELNCGCPQRCAKQGGYGAFLMEAPELLESLVRALAGRGGAGGGGGVRRPDGTRVPVFVKVRVFADEAATVALCLRVQAAGADALTVHGRTRHQVPSLV
jgi:tRNA-dihydrouridine synthase